MLCVDDFETVQQSRTIRMSYTLALNVFLCILSNHNCHCLYEAEESFHSGEMGEDRCSFTIYCLSCTIQKMLYECEVTKDAI